MDLLKWVQAIFVWLSSLSLVPKTIVSVIIICAAGLLLVLIWTPPRPASLSTAPPAPDPAIAEILRNCNRKALLTRMQAQQSWDAMFKSITECRLVVQKQIPDIRDEKVKRIALELLGALDQIERQRSAQHESASEETINRLKLVSIQYLRQLADANRQTFTLPDSGKLAELSFFTEEQANAPISIEDLRNQLAINPKTGEIVP